MADAQDLKSWDHKKSCGFKSRHRHQRLQALTQIYCHLVRTLSRMKTQGAAKETEPKINPNYCEEDGVGYYSRKGITVPIYHGAIRVKDTDYRQHTLSWYEDRRRMR